MLLKTEMAQKKKHLKRMENEIKTSKEHLRSIYSWLDYNHLVSLAANLNIKSLKRVEMVQNRKLENLNLKIAYLSSGLNQICVRKETVLGI